MVFINPQGEIHKLLSMISLSYIKYKVDSVNLVTF